MHTAPGFSMVIRQLVVIGGIAYLDKLPRLTGDYNFSDICQIIGKYDQLLKIK